MRIKITLIFIATLATGQLYPIKWPQLLHPKQHAPTPSVTRTYLYAQINQSWERIEQPMLKETERALAWAYEKPVVKQARRLLPRQITGFWSSHTGAKASETDKTKTATAIQALCAELGYTFNPGAKTWQAKNSRIGQIMQACAFDPNEWEIPAGGFSSYNDFFIRQLKPHTRPIAGGADTLTSPVDGTCLVIDPVSVQPGQATFFNVKSTTFDLIKFLGDARLAAPFEGGTLLLFRLAPYHYHHFHAPTAMIVAPAQVIGGGFDAIDPAVYRAGHNPLITNRRHLIPLHTYHGDLLMVAVGAFGIGTIKETYTPHAWQKKGADLGHFQYGGSCIALLAPKNTIAVDSVLLAHSREGFETAVKMGQKIGVGFKNPQAH